MYDGYNNMQKILS